MIRTDGSFLDGDRHAWSAGQGASLRRVVYPTLKQRGRCSDLRTQNRVRNVDDSPRLSSGHDQPVKVALYREYREGTWRVPV
jgi:hypothetical protein